MHIDFLWYEDCPSHPQARAMLQAALDELGLEPTIAERQVRTEAEAHELAFPGSPTIRVDGQDIDLEGAAVARPALTCRTYRWRDGRFQPLPERVQLLAALRAGARHS